MTTSISAPRVLDLEPSRFGAGVGVWGALPAIYDTTTREPEHGVHVHARSTAGRKKDIDESFDVVNVVLPTGTFPIREIDATPYVAGAVLGLPLNSVRCPYCRLPHLDEERFAIHPHQRHLCAACKMEFLEPDRTVGNPILLVKHELGDPLLTRKTVVGRRGPTIDQSASYCAGGILIWGSNPAILWTAAREEQSGIHVHAFRNATDPPTIDETYASVEIDGISLDAEMVRVFMIQRSLGFLSGAVQHVRCTQCSTSHFDAKAPFAVEPHQNHTCTSCGLVLISKVPVVSNPIVDVLSALYANAAKVGMSRNPLAP